jgi:N4-gp56 family major capsid protein
MASTNVLSGLELTKWRREFIRAYVRDSGFEPYMGDSEMDIIHVVTDLKTDGYTIRVPLVADLKANGVSGNQKLTGNEEQMDQYYQDISWEFYRHAVETTKKETKKSAVDLLAVKRPLLRSWASELIKYQLIDSFHKMYASNSGAQEKYSDASEATKDAWLTRNADRVLFGNAISNHGTDHSAALANIDTTNDKLTAASVHLLKRRARMAYPRIRPFKTGTQGREYFLMFTHPRNFRDLKKDTTIAAANRDARPRDVNSNPIFQDGDIIYDGIIFREIPEFEVAKHSSDINAETTLEGVGNSSSDVGVNFLCGCQAIGMVNKQAATPVSKKEDDYGFVDGVGIELAHGIEKLTWGNGSENRKDLGIVTAYFSASADT